ncbi:hypothetical protein NUW54_g2145 [Trametes sanguinea]|uniref:Uncharacterized protein n=1 Tax=Trametes sanguinea TaxID=158606 RepID=A0ACC1Q859_9APHY|nr:hypothetical protein NUW54_g2145 [Trametes sanguinea]
MLPPRAYFFLGLNGVRILSIISLLLVFASSIFVLVNDVEAVNRSMKSDVDMTDCDYIEGSTVPNQPAGVFWAVVNRLLIIFQVIVLIMSEVGWPAAFFERYFPVLGPNFGLGALGIFQCLIGATTPLAPRRRLHARRRLLPLLWTEPLGLHTHTVFLRPFRSIYLSVPTTTTSTPHASLLT